MIWQPIIRTAALVVLLTAAFVHIFVGRSPNKVPAADAIGDPHVGLGWEASDQALRGARSALTRGDTGSALDILTKAHQQNPGQPGILHLRAILYGRLDRWEEALTDANAGLKIIPGNMTLLNAKALSENRTHRFREALATAESMIELDPRDPWGYVNRAGARVGLGDRKASLADIKRAAALDGKFQQAADDAERQ